MNWTYSEMNWIQSVIYWIHLVINWMCSVMCSHSSSCRLFLLQVKEMKQRHHERKVPYQQLQQLLPLNLHLYDELKYFLRNQQLPDIEQLHPPGRSRLLQQTPCLFWDYTHEIPFDSYNIRQIYICQLDDPISSYVRQV